MLRMKTKRVASVTLGAALVLLAARGALAHHSFAMYDTKKVYVMTGVVTRVDPNPNHLQIFFAPLNEARDAVLRDANGEPIVWAVEMDGASIAARQGITVNGFPRGTIISVGLHPLRNGFPGGGRGKNGLFKCPPDTPPAPGKHCDSVAGSTSHGEGVLPEPTDPVPTTVATK
jgi:Family of unknown function (DUF6152)